MAEVSSMIEIAQKINKSQDLSGIKVGLNDEIFQSGLPVLTGIDAFSTYCYLLVGEEHRDEDTWGWHLLEASQQGLNPDFSIADAAKGLRAGSEAAWPGKPCHGDTFHILHKTEGLENYLNRRAKALTGQREKLELKMEKAKTKGQGNRWSTKLTNARRAEQKAIILAKDLSILCDWLKQDVLALAGPDCAERAELWDFIVAEFKQRESQCLHRIRPVRTALENQKKELLAFALVLDEKLGEISQRFDIPLYWVRQICLLIGQNKQENAYWSAWNKLHQKIGYQFYLLFEAVEQAMKETPRASSLVENFNGTFPIHLN